MDIAGEICGSFQEADIPNATAVLANAPQLVLPYEANGIFPFAFELHVPFALAGVVSGYKFFLSDSAGSSVYTSFFEVYDGVAGVLVQSGIQIGASANIAGALATVGNHYLRIRGTILLGPGTLQLQFAQNVADAAAISILKGAYIRAHYV